MLVLLRGQLRDFFAQIADGTITNEGAVEDVSRWINSRLPSWDREYLFTPQSCNQLVKYVTVDLDRTESVCLLHSWLIETSEESKVLRLTR